MSLRSDYKIGAAMFVTRCDLGGEGAVLIQDKSSGQQWYKLNWAGVQPKLHDKKFNY